MWKCLGVLALTGTICAAQESGLAGVAQSPYDLEQYIETHAVIRWQPLWDAWKLRDRPHLTDCEERSSGHSCSPELMTVLHPYQMIEIVHDESGGAEAYFRFLPVEGEGSQHWRFAGAFEPARGIRTEHRLVMFGNKPYLAITGQGMRGSNLSSQIEEWIDLTASDFRPVFSYTVRGEKKMPGQISLVVTGTVASLRRDPERIEVHYSATFTLGGDLSRPLGTSRDAAVYSHTADERFQFDEKYSKSGRRAVFDIYENLLEHVTPEEYLSDDLPGLKQAASGRDEAAKRALEALLEHCKDTPEKRELLTLLRRK